MTRYSACGYKNSQTNKRMNKYNFEFTIYLMRKKTGCEQQPQSEAQIFTAEKEIKMEESVLFLPHSDSSVKLLQALLFEVRKRTQCCLPLEVGEVVEVIYTSILSTFLHHHFPMRNKLTLSIILTT